MNGQLLAVVTMVCHTVVLVAVIIVIGALASSKVLTPEAIAALTSLGSITGAGLVLNGQKYKQREADVFNNAQSQPPPQL